VIEHIDDSDALLRRIPDRPGQLWTRRPDEAKRAQKALAEAAAWIQMPAGALELP
jgi:hypothetical protein